MRKQGRSDEKNEGRSEGETNHKELNPLLWQAHVHEEMERIVREHQPAPGLSHFAEEYAERAMRGVDTTANEFQQAAKRGETRAAEGTPGDIADAGDIAGG